MKIRVLGGRKTAVLFAMFLLTVVMTSQAGLAQDIGDLNDAFGDSRPGGRRDRELLLRMVREVTLYQEVAGQVVRSLSTRDDIQSCCPGCFSVDGRTFYDSLRTMNRETAMACTSRATPGAHINVSRKMRNLCRSRPGLFSNDLNYGTAVNYSLTHREDGIHVGLHLRLNPRGIPVEREREILDRTRECIPEIRRVWQRSGVIFDLTFDTERFRGRDPNNIVEVNDGTGRSNSGTFHFNGVAERGPWARCDAACGANGSSDCLATCERTRQLDYCLMILHETGHLVGLPDEYDDDDCPDRKTLRPESPDPRFATSVMNNSKRGWNYVEFYPDHIETVTGPLCPRR